jgi:hypothetical protein
VGARGALGTRSDATPVLTVPCPPVHALADCCWGLSSTSAAERETSPFPSAQMGSLASYYSIGLGVLALGTLASVRALRMCVHATLRGDPEGERALWQRWSLRSCPLITSRFIRPPPGHSCSA